MVQNATNYVVIVWITKLVITWTEDVQTAAQRDGKMMSAKRVSIYWFIIFELHLKNIIITNSFRIKNGIKKHDELNKNCYRTWRYFAPVYASPLSFMQSVIRVTLDWCVRMNAVPIAWILCHVITWQGHVTADVKMAG